MVKEHKTHEWRDRFNELCEIRDLFKKRLEGNKEAKDAFNVLNLSPIEVNANTTQEGCREAAETLHDQIISALTKVDDDTLETLLGELRNVKREDRHKPIYYKSGWRYARYLYKHADLAKDIPDEREKNEVLRWIAIDLAKARSFKEAERLAKDMPNVRRKNEALCDIAIELAKARNFEEAERLAKGIPDESKKNEALRDISIELDKRDLES